MFPLPMAAPSLAVPFRECLSYPCPPRRARENRLSRLFLRKRGHGLAGGVESVTLRPVESAYAEDLS